jgi:hypothetical protein
MKLGRALPRRQGPFRLRRTRRIEWSFKKIAADAARRLTGFGTRRHSCFAQKIKLGGGQCAANDPIK